MKSKKEGLKIDTWGDNFTYMYMGIRLRWTYENQIWREGSQRRCNHLFQTFPLTLTIALTTVLPVILSVSHKENYMLLTCD